MGEYLTQVQGCRRQVYPPGFDVSSHLAKPCKLSGVGCFGFYDPWYHQISWRLQAGSCRSCYSRLPPQHLHQSTLHFNDKRNFFTVVMREISHLMRAWGESKAEIEICSYLPLVPFFSFLFLPGAGVCSFQREARKVTSTYGCTYWVCHFVFETEGQ